MAAVLITITICIMFFMAILTLCVFLGNGVVNYLKGKAEELRARAEKLRKETKEMIPINTLLGVLACLVCLLAVTSFALLIKVQALHERCVQVMLCVYDWLEQHKQEAEKREGTN